MADSNLLNSAQQTVQAINNLSATLKTVLAVVQTTATTASPGSATLPASPAGFLVITLPNGTSAKVPYYNV